MAKLTLSVDTETNTLEVTVNGEKIDNVSYVTAEQYQIFNYDKNVLEIKAHFNVMITSKDESGLIQTSHLMAQQNLSKNVAELLGE
jgi:hypothetical protein